MTFSYKSTVVNSFFTGNNRKKSSRGMTRKGMTPRGMTRKGMMSRGMTRRNDISISNNKGIKSVSILDLNGKQVFQNSIPLTKKEISCIRKNRFIPNLFKDCVKEIHTIKTMRTNHRKTRRQRK